MLIVLVSIKSLYNELVSDVQGSHSYHNSICMVPWFKMYMVSQYVRTKIIPNS